MSEPLVGCREFQRLIADLVVILPDVSSPWIDWIDRLQEWDARTAKLPLFRLSVLLPLPD
jgi:hypothetical protein